MKTLLCTLLFLSSVYAEHNDRHDNARDLFIGLETAIIVDKIINHEPQYAPPRYIEPRQEVIIIDRRPMPPRYYRDEFGVLREIIR